MEFFLYIYEVLQNVLGRTNLPLSFSTTRTAEVNNKLMGHTYTDRQQGDLISLVSLKLYGVARIDVHTVISISVIRLYLSPEPVASN
jgi:hypothetical protein